MQSTTLDYFTLLWLRYVLSAESASRHVPRTFTSYGNLLEDPVTVLRKAATILEVSWPKMALPTVEKAIRASISPAYRHHKIAQKNLPSDHRCVYSAQRVFEIFKRWVRKEIHPSDTAELDNIKGIVDDVTSVLTDVIKDREAYISGLHQTLSWRITEPLRFVRRFQRKLMS